MGRAIYPAPGTAKAVQRVSGNVLYGQTDISITPVNMAKTKLNVPGPGCGSSTSQAPGWTVYLLNASTLRITSVLGGGATITVNIEVIEEY